MFVYDINDKICIDFSKVIACRVLRSPSALGVISFESASCSGHNITFPSYYAAKRAFDLMMISLQNGSSFFEIDDSIKYNPDELPFD